MFFSSTEKCHVLGLRDRVSFSLHPPGSFGEPPPFRSKSTPLIVCPCLGRCSQTLLCVLKFSSCCPGARQAVPELPGELRGWCTGWCNEENRHMTIWWHHWMTAAVSRLKIERKWRFLCSNKTESLLSWWTLISAASLIMCGLRYSFLNHPHETAGNRSLATSKQGKCSCIYIFLLPTASHPSKKKGHKQGLIKRNVRNFNNYGYTVKISSAKQLVHIWEV